MKITTNHRIKKMIAMGVMRLSEQSNMISKPVGEKALNGTKLIQYNYKSSFITAIQGFYQT